MSDRYLAILVKLGDDFPVAKSDYPIEVADEILELGGQLAFHYQECEVIEAQWRESTPPTIYKD